MDIIQVPRDTTKLTEKTLAALGRIEELNLGHDAVLWSEDIIIAIMIN